MSVTIELPPETETLLTVTAAEQGVSLAQYVSRVVVPALRVPRRPALSSAERVALLHKMAQTATQAPPLSDTAISRESIYDTRG